MTTPAAPDPVIAPNGPATVSAVAGWLGANDPQFAEEQEHIAAVVPAVNSWLRTWITVPADGAAWPEHIVHGAVMLAARNVRRRMSPAGVETGGDLGGAVYVARWDRDLDQLLGLGDYRRLVVG